MLATPKIVKHPRAAIATYKPVLSSSLSCFGLFGVKMVSGRGGGDGGFDNLYVGVHYRDGGS